MQSYPYQKDQMHYGPHYYPGTEAIPCQMFVNPARPPMNHEYWPWGSNYGCGYGHPSPMVCHGCCNHSFVPNHYAWRPPCSHAPPVHYPGNYQFFPVQYMPPPSYAMEQPRYEYEKNVPGDHNCCGCPNHPSHHKEHKNLRIEEEELDRERKKNDSVVPFQFKNNKPYPIVWLPPDYNKNKEHWKPHNLEDRIDDSLEVKPYENQRSVQQQPTLRNGWYPVDLNNFVSSKQTGEGDRNHHEEDDGMGRFPFPLFWIPYKPEGEEIEEPAAKDGNTKLSLESDKGSGDEQHLKRDGESIMCQTVSRAKDIPVKEAEQNEVNETSKNKEKERDALVKDGIDNGQKKVDNGEKKVAKDGAKRKSSSPPKSPKLPPVCLRVDPLPRRKGANGSSRSPSPPGDKQKVDQRSNEATKILTSSGNTKAGEVANNGPEAGKGITKTIDVVDGKTGQSKSIDVNVETPVNLPVKTKEDVLKKQTDEKPKEETLSQKYSESTEALEKGQLGDAEFSRKNEEILKANEVSSDDAKGTAKRKLSGEEAAVIIQSAYRGFDIRRWEPIKKLKQIAKVREQIAEVTRLIQAMGASSDSQVNTKQRNIIAETIMSLLLKLDMIQGLHPSIRDIRKAVVRELVSLQEKLDSLMNEKFEASLSQKSIKRDEEDASNETVDVVNVSSQNDNETPSDLSGAHQNQLDGGSNNKNCEIKEANVIGEPPSEKLDNKTAESCVTEAPKSASQDSAETTKNADENEDIVQKGASAESTEYAPTAHDQIENELTELPMGVCDELDTQESSGQETGEGGEAEQGEEGSVEADITSELNELPFSGVETDITSELNELPFSGVETISEKENMTSDVLEPYEEREIPVTEACIQKDSMCNILSEETQVDDNAKNLSMSEGATDQPQEQEIPLEQEVNAHDVAEDMSEHVQIRVADAEDHGEVIDKEPQMMEGCNKNGDSETEVLNEEILLPKENLEDDNRKLIAENERLRDMMEKLIKSGQEQLMAISTLSGRVKDLEKKLSRKKKLKMKQCRGPKSASLIHEAI